MPPPVYWPRRSSVSRTDLDHEASGIWCRTAGERSRVIGEGQLPVPLVVRNLQGAGGDSSTLKDWTLPPRFGWPKCSGVSDLNWWPTTRKTTPQECADRSIWRRLEPMNDD